MLVSCLNEHPRHFYVGDNISPPSLDLAAQDGSESRDEIHVKIATAHRDEHRWL